MIELWLHLIRQMIQLIVTALTAIMIRWMFGLSTPERDAALVRYWLYGLHQWLALQPLWTDLQAAKLRFFHDRYHAGGYTDDGGPALSIVVVEDVSEEASTKLNEDHQ